MKRGELGVAVIGAGRIGTLRARLAAKHPSVGFLAIADVDAGRASALAGQAGTDMHSTSNFEMIERPEVDAVFVSTPEGEHAAPIIRALALDLNDADHIIETLHATKGKPRVGYSRRFKECFLRAKEQMIHERLGTVVGTSFSWPHPQRNRKKPWARMPRSRNASNSSALR